ncbi:MAG: dihydroorotate dehydrogenase [Sclerophora amabilis]|nr:MAG: dihydroorotate dehydrogenase [Sclerophora amabilis]
MPLNFTPPLLNSANPWATTEDDLRALYASPHTGAVTTRTCILNGFAHDDQIHQYTFFDTHAACAPSASTTSNGAGDGGGAAARGVSSIETKKSSLNTLGYSPFPLSYYLAAIPRITRLAPPLSAKPFIISITGSPAEVAECYHRISAFASAHPSERLLVELNLSCPNIPSAPPPAYSRPLLTTYLNALADAREGELLRHKSGDTTSPSSPNQQAQEQGQKQKQRQQHPPLIGIKTPPFTYTDQFETVLGALRENLLARPQEEQLVVEGGRAEQGGLISFITATNTLGNCLVLDSQPAKNDHREDAVSSAAQGPALASANGTGIGGMAGEALHPLALGNVRTWRAMLDRVEGLKRVAVIGVGGVGDAEAARRMRSVGAEAVGIGTALGREGVGVFEKIVWGVW